MKILKKFRQNLKFSVGTVDSIAPTLHSSPQYERTRWIPNCNRTKFVSPKLEIDG